MIGALLSQPVVFGTSISELLMDITLITFVLGAWKATRCHQYGCRNRLGLRRWGRYRHGHLNLCHAHHPDVPNDGRVTAAHVAAVRNRLS